MVSSMLYNRKKREISIILIYIVWTHAIYNAVQRDACINLAYYTKGSSVKVNEL